MNAFLLAVMLSAQDASAPPIDSASPIDAESPIDAAPPIDSKPSTAPLAQPLPWFAIARVRTHEPVVALTFDACATLKQDNGFDREVFDILKREQIPVTVFPTVRWIETHPAEAKELAAQAWIEFGNHTYSHARMTRIPRRKAVDRGAVAPDEVGHRLERGPGRVRRPRGTPDRS